MERNTERERARKTERRQHRAQRRLEAATQRSPEATEKPATPATGWQALGFLGQNQGLERRNASNTAAMNCISLALSLASSLRSDPA